MIQRLRDILSAFWAYPEDPLVNNKLIEIEKHIDNKEKEQITELQDTLDDRLKILDARISVRAQRAYKGK